MSNPRPLPDDLRRLDREAAAWLVKRDRGLTADEQDMFSQWLAADPRHGELYAAHRRTWKSFDKLAEWKPEHSMRPNPDLLACLPVQRRRLRWSWAGAALAASLTVSAWIGWQHLQRASQSDDGLRPHRVVARDYLRQVLEDGSVIELNRGAQIEIAYTATERRIFLRAGEAGFTVVKNRSRPFIVRAGGVEVRAVGTAFNVNLASQQVDVLVTEGRVRVEDALKGVSVLPAGMSDEPPVLTAGQRITVGVVSSAPVAVTEVLPAEMTRLLGWRPDLLEFDDTPLSAVVGAFNRRNTVQLVLADAELRQLPIVATFRADNVEGFVRLLEITAHIRAERRGGEIVLHAP